jgi:hypothetical protein
VHDVRGTPRCIEFAQLSDKRALELTVELKDSPPHFRFGADSALKADMAGCQFRAKTGRSNVPAQRMLTRGQVNVRYGCLRAKR